MRVLRAWFVVALIAGTLVWWSRSRAGGPRGLPFDPVQTDGQTVTLRGTETNLHARVSQRGNAYFTFDLDTGSGRVRVFEFGAPPCPDQSRVTVEGVFHHVKHVSAYTFYDQVDAQRITCQSP